MESDDTVPTPPEPKPEDATPEDATVAVPRRETTGGSPARPPSGASGVSSSSVPSLDGGRFGPGTLLAGRYRIVGMLGKGGMGEVYRADDLTLGQSVAVKFLPEEVALDPDRRRRFHDEVRVAREIAHPNVCRVYDIGDVDGLTFLTMEFVDGEDLGSLLRRIGRLPHEKAVEIARQLCAGIAGLHDRGVLHRDLKPANVMVDGRGRVRITDFGLAGFGGTIEGAEIRAGTPAYMAPEQISGEGVDARSDIYALGLVLYEIFTGKRAFRADTLPELKRLQRESTPTSPSTILPDIDPAVDSVIARCLEKNPDRRPTSAISVAAALPGGDPLAAALAAGEIPSLEMVAAAGGEGHIRPIVAWACVAAVVVGIAVTALFESRDSMVRWDPVEKPPAVLRERAREVLALVGHEAPADDTAHGYLRNRDVVAHLRRTREEGDRWEPLKDARPAGVLYWYRQSPTQFVPLSNQKMVTRVDPAPRISGMAEVLLDTTGRLWGLSIVPPQRETPFDSSAATAESAIAPSGPVDWGPVFAAAGLDPGGFEAADPEWVPPHWADERFAWTETAPADTGFAMRVEAASYGGRPVHFEIHGPWSRADRMVGPASDRAEIVIEAVLVLAILSMFSGGVWLAIRNVRLGIGDRVGAGRLGVFVLLLSAITWTLTVNHATSTSSEINMLFDALSSFLFGAVLFSAFYLALEPFVRKLMPDRIVSWTRLLTGRFRDPLVGRDVLFGCALFGAYMVLQATIAFLSDRFGHPLPRLEDPQWEALLGTNFALGVALSRLLTSIFNALFFLLFFIFLRKLVRSQPVAVLVYVAVFALIGWWSGPGDADTKWINCLAIGLVGLLFAFTFLRFGLLSFLVMFFGNQIVSGFPMTLDGSRWFSGSGMFGMGVLLAVAIYGVWASAPSWSAREAGAERV